MRRAFEIARDRIKRSVEIERGLEKHFEAASRRLWPWGESRLVALVVLLAMLDYTIEEWAAFWINMMRADLSSFDKLVFDIRADPEFGIPNQFKVELKRPSKGEVSIAYVRGVREEWATFSIDLDEFRGAGYDSPLSSFEDIEELVLTFEARHSGRHGVVYLDKILAVHCDAETPHYACAAQ